MVVGGGKLAQVAVERANGLGIFAGVANETGQTTDGLGMSA